MRERDEREKRKEERGEGREIKEKVGITVICGCHINI